MENFLSPKQATTVVIVHDGKILIGQRVKDDLWELPGGKIDENENPQECAQREIEEELNITITIERSLGKLSGIYRDIPMDVFGFLATWSGGELQAKVHKDIQWISPDDISQYPFIDEDFIFVRKYQESL